MGECGEWGEWGEWGVWGVWAKRRVGETAKRRSEARSAGKILA
jgi:hypothetical protein